jgi:hypothetical protein
MRFYQYLACGGIRYRFPLVLTKIGNRINEVEQQQKRFSWVRQVIWQVDERRKGVYDACGFERSNDALQTPLRLGNFRLID